MEKGAEEAPRRRARHGPFARSPTQAPIDARARIIAILCKATDPRAAEFVRCTGQLVQVELEALHPDDLRGLYEAVLADY